MSYYNSERQKPDNGVELTLMILYAVYILPFMQFMEANKEGEKGKAALWLILWLLIVIGSIALFIWMFFSSRSCPEGYELYMVRRDLFNFFTPEYTIYKEEAPFGNIEAESYPPVVRVETPTTDITSVFFPCFLMGRPVFDEEYNAGRYQPLRFERSLSFVSLLYPSYEVYKEPTDPTIDNNNKIECQDFMNRGGELIGRVFYPVGACSNIGACTVSCKFNCKENCEPDNTACEDECDTNCVDRCEYDCFIELGQATGLGLTGLEKRYVVQYYKPDGTINSYVTTETFLQLFTEGKIVEEIYFYRVDNNVESDQVAIIKPQTGRAGGYTVCINEQLDPVEKQLLFGTIIAIDQHRFQKERENS